MKLRFYFDYSDYRSYLMLPALDALSALPLSIQWIVVDAFSLRALSGIRLPDTPSERAWLRQEAMRFAWEHKIPLVWRNDPIHNGHALRAGVWLMRHNPDAFLVYSRRIMQMIWADGIQPDVARLRALLEELLPEEDIVDTIFSDATAKDHFIYQDMYLQQALSDGVFDVSTLVCNTAVFCRFDQTAAMRREILSQLLQTLPAENLRTLLLDLLLCLPTADCSEKLRALASDKEVRVMETRAFPQQPLCIHPHTAPPHAVWPLPQSALKADLPVRRILLPEQSADPLAMIIAQAPDNGLALVIGELAFTSQNAILKTLRSVNQTRHIVTCLRDAAHRRMMYARTGAKDAHILIADADNLLVPFPIKTWKCVLCAPEASTDIHLARRAAGMGAHLIIRTTATDELPVSEAWGYLTHAWIATLGSETAFLADAFGHSTPCFQEDMRLTPLFRLNAMPAWEPPPPRTLLLCDHALSIGPLSAGADLELSCRMQNLEVATAFQKSEILSSRTSERLRIGEILIQLIPISGDQICVPELVAYKLLQTLNRAHAQSIPVLVNYWSDLEFDTLETMRPLHALIVDTWRIPLALVVLSQVVEVWQANAQGTVYRIEKEGDAFVLDLDESMRAEQCLPTLLTRQGISAEQFIERLHQNEEKTE